MEIEASVNTRYELSAICLKSCFLHWECIELKLHRAICFIYNKPFVTKQTQEKPQLAIKARSKLQSCLIIQ